MEHTYHLTRMSSNAKTGPIPVSTTDASTCPTCCPLRGHGCYAEAGKLRLHWDKLSDGRRGVDLDTFCGQLQALPRHQLWRWAQAGDLPGDGRFIDTKALTKIVEAQRGRAGFGFTHYDPLLKTNAKAIRAAVAGGFVLNLSANNIAHADELVKLGVAPVVVVLPKDVTRHFRTPAGNHVSVCPATVRDDITCARCGICQVSTRKAIIGFPAHGNARNQAQAIALSPAMTKSMTKRSRPMPIDAGLQPNGQRKRA